MKIKIVGIVYIFLLLVFALSSIFPTWANNSSEILAVEIIVDLIFIAGVILSIRGLRHRGWIVPFIIALMGETYLLIISKQTTTTDILLWCIILAPALYFHSVIIGLRSNQRNIKTNT